MSESNGNGRRMRSAAVIAARASSFGRFDPPPGPAREQYGVMRFIGPAGLDWLDWLIHQCHGGSDGQASCV
jgi:hypothetical protein